MKTLISVSNLSKTYAGGFQALKSVNLDIFDGEILALLGPNGAGKTTLISAICGIINPSEFAPANSIEIVVWVALGGRGTLFGAALGAVSVNLAKSYLTAAFPEVWLFALGALFIAVTLFLPKGMAGSIKVPLPAWVGGRT